MAVDLRGVVLWAPSLAVAMGVAGCGGGQKQVVQDEPPAGEPVAVQSDPAAAEAEAYAQRLEAAMRTAEAQRIAEPAPPEVQWLKGGQETPAAPQSGVGPSAEAVVESPPPVAEPVAEAAPAPRPAEADAPPSRDELVRRLAAEIAAGRSPDMIKAIDAATLATLAPATGLDRAVLEPLGFEDRDLVDRYHHVLTLIRDTLASGDGGLDRVALDARLDALFGEQPIKIRRVALCRRVQGFGVYEPFESHTFLAGRDQKAIVYVELDQFRASEVVEGQYEVKLQQEVALFNESDGLAVWRNEPVQIVDASRNRRRDFFLVQLVTLPARLSVGKYRLKVRITDLHGGSIDETTAPIEIVADESLVKNGG